MTREPPGPERRRHPRLWAALPVTVLAVTAAGALFACRTHLDNLSAGGFYVRLPRRPAPGSPVLARLRAVLLPPRGFVRLAAGGAVRRVEAGPDGWYGTAVQLAWRHLLLRP
jgi:hypothetical protein